jgi:transketolase
MKAQRQVWGETLLEASLRDPRVRVLDADLATSTRSDLVAEGNPDAFVQIGIAEQNMLGMALGLSTMGYRPWVSSFSVFLTHRAIDQVRMLVSQTKAPIRIAASYAGLLNGASGKTHQDLADLAIMRAMPNMTVIAPADEHEARAATRWACDHDGPVFVRYARDAVAPVFDEEDGFEPGVPRLVREGADVVLVSTGVQTSRVLRAAEQLSVRGIDAAVVHVATLKPVDEDVLHALLAPFPLAVSVEEHAASGGLGSLVAEVLATRAEGPRLAIHALPDRWSESGPSPFLLDRYGLSAERVVERVVAELGA